MLLERAIRLWPHRSPGEGHFIALLQRSEHVPGEGRTRSYHLSRPTSTTLQQARHLYQDFARRNLSQEQAAADPPALALHGTYLYSLPPDLPALSGLKVVHPGLWLGIIKKDRFEPAHALAHSLPPSAALRSLSLSPDSPAVQAYLRGETIPAAAHYLTGDGEGWVLVTLTGSDGKPGFPLGWGKLTAGQPVKNFYPKGLRQY